MKPSYPNMARMGFALAAIAACAVASAATQTFNFTIDPFQTTATKAVSLSQFNPALGTLTGVTFGIKDTITSTISLSNESTSSTNFLVGTADVSMTFKDSGGNTLLSDSLQNKAGSGINIAGAYAVKPSSGADLFVSPYGGVYNPTTTGSSLTKVVSSPFTAYIGTGLLSYSFTATGIGTTTGPTGGNPANYVADYVTNASAVGFVTYTYQPVPEPASFAAFGIGAIALVRRRKGGRK